MNEEYRQAGEFIGKTAEEIHTVNLMDRSAWSRICSDLERVAKDLPQGRNDVSELLDLCLKGLSLVARKPSADCFTLLEEVSRGLEVSQEMLNGKTDSDCIGVRTGLEKILGIVPGPSGKQSPDSMEGATVDDALALLVSLDPAQPSEVERLEGLLLKLAEDPLHQGRSGEKILAALSRFRSVRAEGSDTGSILEEVGRLLEEGIELKDETRAGRPPEPGQPAETDNHLPKDADPDLLREFVTEATDLIVSAEEALLTLETEPEDMEAVGTVFRAFHTVKGTSAFLELALIAELGHHAENLLSRVRDREIRYSGGYADLALRALDMIKELVQAVEDAIDGSPLRKPGGYDELLSVLSDPEEAGISEEFDDSVATPRIGDILVAQGKASREKIEEAVSAGGRNPIGVAVVQSGTASLQDVGHALRTQERMKGTRSLAESSVRVRTDRLDRLIDMVGEMVIAHSMVAQDEVVVAGNNHDLQKKVSHTNKIVRELQGLSMSMRMIPLKATFQKMARLVRDVSRKMGKNVSFVTEGEDTEIDRNMVDVINDPLIHMIRNAVDHGIEMPEERTRAGKTSHGTVKLSAYHSAGNVVVEIVDDGKGLDHKSILEKAREKGMVADGASLSEREMLNLIFEPGFSTAKTVTDVSGRGVGLDVVKKNIESLRGQVEIQSEKGKGTVFKMSLPLTLAIIDGMVVRVGQERYILPTISIIRTVKPDVSHISTLLQRGEMLMIQRRLIPLFRLAELFGRQNDVGSLTQALVVVVEEDGKQAGLVVDELIGRQQIVIKSLGQVMGNIPGISGGAIMPNGRVGLILDVGGLIRIANANESHIH